MSDVSSATCPQCGADVTLEAYSEYQGVRPHGAHVTYVEPVDRACECEWSDDDWTDMHEQAIDNLRREPEYDPTEPTYHHPHRP